MCTVQTLKWVMEDGRWVQRAFVLSVTDALKQSRPLVGSSGLHMLSQRFPSPDKISDAQRLRRMFFDDALQDGDFLADHSQHVLRPAARHVLFPAVEHTAAAHDPQIQFFVGHGRERSASGGGVNPGGGQT